MIFLGYEFVWFALAFFPLYYLATWPAARIAVVIAGGFAFQLYYGGWASLVPVAILGSATFAAGRSGNRALMAATIVLCVAALATYKYTNFLVTGVIGAVLPELGDKLKSSMQGAIPAVIPLGISFFTFEFVHYLTDVRSGAAPLQRIRDFTAFIFFWPTMVAGPIKRYQQFVPAMNAGLKSPTAQDVALGLIRVTIGFFKKWCADTLTAWIEIAEPSYMYQSLLWRWLFVLALAWRIYLDFSGYSDMAIGFARMMGIAVPENFNWPYLARTPMEFWQRWHISLSTWIRDYVYIPLGGNRLGMPRRVVNALIAMALCGLWHGPAWNFVAWGFYHGIGLVAAALLARALGGRSGETPARDGAQDTLLQRLIHIRHNSVVGNLRGTAAWLATMLFVGIGWLLFFYPVGKAFDMAARLFVRNF